MGPSELQESSGPRDYDDASIATHRPIVYILPLAKKKLDLYILRCSEEISGVGKVLILGDDFLIVDIFIFPQDVTIGSTDLHIDALHQYVFDAVQAGIPTGTTKVWWHSHVKIEADWSVVDDATARSFKNSWMLSIVGNKFGEYRVRLDIFKPVTMTIDNLPLRVYYPEDDELSQMIDKEIKEKVSFRGPQTYKTYQDFQHGQRGACHHAVCDSAQQPPVSESLSAETAQSRVLAEISQVSGPFAPPPEIPTETELKG